MAKQFVLTRDVPVSECHWLERDFKAGETVFEFTGYTYGCISHRGKACTEKPNETPFFELPRNALGSEGLGVHDWVQERLGAAAEKSEASGANASSTSKDNG